VTAGPATYVSYVVVSSLAATKRLASVSAQLISVSAGRAMLAKDLDSALKKAWNNPGHWVKLIDLRDGVKSVLVKVKTSKKGLNYWLFGYQLTSGSIVWRARKRPLRW